MNESHGNKEITAKEAGLKVKDMIEAVEKRMAAGEKVSAASVSKDEAKISQINRKDN